MVESSAPCQSRQRDFPPALQQGKALSHGRPIRCGVEPNSAKTASRGGGRVAKEAGLWQARHGWMIGPLQPQGSSTTGGRRRPDSARLEAVVRRRWPCLGTAVARGSGGGR